MLQTYLHQLEDAAARNGVRLLDAYLEAGLADSNYYRHRQGVHEVSEKIAVRCPPPSRSWAASDRGKAA
jgi:hypothetical protein